MASTRDEFLREWHRIVETRDLGALAMILADDVSMGAPPYWDKLQGRPLVHHLLGLILATIEGFTYHREWHAESQSQRDIALEFHGSIGNLQLQGIDLITLNEEGTLQNLDVMIRPMNALSALRDTIAPQMAEFLQRGTGAPR